MLVYGLTNQFPLESGIAGQKCTVQPPFFSTSVCLPTTRPDTQRHLIAVGRCQKIDHSVLIRLGVSRTAFSHNLESEKAGKKKLHFIHLELLTANLDFGSKPWKSINILPRRILKILFSIKLSSLYSFLVLFK